MELNKNHLIERFNAYVHFDTQSNEEKKSCPSTPGQLLFAKYLLKEMQAIGLTEIELDENGYLMASLPANGCPEAPVVGLISHMDTSPDLAGSPAHPRIVKTFDGLGGLARHRLDLARGQRNPAQLHHVRPVL